MQFLFPNFLWALALLAIPILIHLFFFRRFKRVYFTNVKFLKEIKEETANRSKLKNILILLSRLLALAAIIFAFAQPFLKKQKSVQKSNQAISIFIDNSFSMQGQNETGSLLNAAKKRALEITDAFSNDDQFQILSHNFEGKSLRFVSKEDAKSIIDGISATSSIKDLNKIYTKQLSTLKTSGFPSGSIYLISDFQKNNALDQLQIDTSYVLNLVPIQAVVENNISIDSAWLFSPVSIPGQANPVLCKFTNYGKQDQQNISVQLKVGNQTYPASTINIPAGKSVVDTMQLSGIQQGWQSVEISIQDFPIQFDDSYFLSFNATQEIKVLVIDETNKNQYLVSALNANPYIKADYVSIQQLNYNILSNYRLIILNEINTLSSGLQNSIKKVVVEGCNLIIFPSPNIDLASYAAFGKALQTPLYDKFSQEEKKVSIINTDEYLFNDVFIKEKINMQLPISLGQYSFSKNRQQSLEEIMQYRDGSSFLLKSIVDKGIVYSCAAPLQEKYNNYSKIAELFVPFLFKAAIAKSQQPGNAYTIGSADIIPFEPLTQEINIQEAAIKLTGPTEFIPRIKSIGNKRFIEIFDQISQSGVYPVKNNDQVITILAFNYSRKESKPEFYSIEELVKYFGDKVNIIENKNISDISQVIKAHQAGSDIWWWLIVAALLFLYVESLLIRFWKN